MKNIETLKLSGRWRLTARHIKTGNKIVKEGGNLITTVGKVQVADMLIDTAGYDTGVTWCAMGSDDTPPDVGDTTLTVEEVRKVLTSKSRAGNEINLSTFFTAGECSFAIEEGGIFGHSTASLITDSGILFSHFLVGFDNSGGIYDITLEYILKVGA